MDYENYFVEEIYKNKITNPIEILNWYRNLYYTENSNTERGINGGSHKCFVYEI